MIICTEHKVSLQKPGAKHETLQKPMKHGKAEKSITLLLSGEHMSLFYLLFLLINPTKFDKLRLLLKHFRIVLIVSICY